MTNLYFYIKSTPDNYKSITPNIPVISKIKCICFRSYIPCKWKWKWVITGHCEHRTAPRWNVTAAFKASVMKRWEQCLVLVHGTLFKSGRFTRLGIQTRNQSWGERTNLYATDRYRHLCGHALDRSPFNQFIYTHWYIVTRPIHYPLHLKLSSHSLSFLFCYLKHLVKLYSYPSFSHSVRSARQSDRDLS